MTNIDMTNIIKKRCKGLYRYDGTVKVFKAFTDVNRLAIIEMLLSGEKCSCQIEENLTIVQSTLSHHMKILTDSGIVSSRREGKWTYYKISLNGVNIAKDLMDYYTSVCVNEKLNACNISENGGDKVGLFNKKNPNEKSTSVEGASVKVLGTGCCKCDDLMQNTVAALGELGQNTDIEHVTDLTKIVSFGVMTTPSLVIDGKVVSVGRILNKEEVKEIIKKARGL